VDFETESEPPKKSAARFSMAVVLVVLVAFVLGAAVALLWMSTRPGGQQQAASLVAATAIPRPTPTLVAGRSPASSFAAGLLPAVNGISCDALESTAFHIHVHLAIFVDGQEQLIPFGVGVAQPWQVSNTSGVPFVEDGGCFYWVHTHTDDGIVHIESPVRRRFTLGDFFAIWQEPLSSTQVGPAQGAVIAYVNGKRDDTNPNEIALTSHARIQLDVGVDVPPYAFDFPPGD
jgi:hypothetical protein